MGCSGYVEEDTAAAWLEWGQRTRDISPITMQLNGDLEDVVHQLGLKDSGYEITSEVSDVYNCIAWAAGVTDTDWWSYRIPGRLLATFGTPRSPEVSELWCRLFETNEGYSVCDGATRGNRITTRSPFMLLVGEWTHVAQGNWKMVGGPARWETVRGHNPPVAWKTWPRAVYGSVHCIMRRPSSSP